MNAEKYFIGIDVSKRSLDIHLRPVGTIFKVSNTVEGLELLRGKLPAPEQIERIVMESTGGYERECALYLSREGYSVSVINARQGRHFAKAANQLAKTDKVDAKVLAWFAEAMAPLCVRWPAKPNNSLRTW